MKLLTYEMWGCKWRRTINWGWIRYRWETRHCQHKWMPGETKRHPKYVCNVCGAWRWNPITSRIVRIIE